jgi:hypothetical protein
MTLFQLEIDKQMEWFKKLNIKFKIAIGVLGLFIGTLLFLTLSKQFLAKDKLNYELAKNSHELELAHLEQDAVVKEGKLSSLREEREKILRQIDVVEAHEVEIGREMSVEELEGFFNSRGF